jgi:hypothetical protein
LAWALRMPRVGIGQFIDGWNDGCQPFTWTKPADELLTKSIPSWANLVRTWAVATADERKEASRAGH